MATNQQKKKKPKPTKERANKYDEKLTINGSFEDLVRELVTPVSTLKKKSVN